MTPQSKCRGLNEERGAGPEYLKRCFQDSVRKLILVCKTVLEKPPLILLTPSLHKDEASGAPPLSPDQDGLLRGINHLSPETVGNESNPFHLPSLITVILKLACSPSST